MSHRVTDRIARDRGEIGKSIADSIGADIDSVHAVESISLTISETVCESPVCNVSFPPSGLEIEPRRFCSGECRQHASLIRRVARLLENETDERVLKILRGKP
jgi:hypothetical protein